MSCTKEKSKVGKLRYRIKLLTITEQQDGFGQLERVTTTEKTVFANKKSVGRSEFYQSANSGHNPSVLFEIRLREYSNENKVVYDGKEYRIIKSYCLDNKYVELTCEDWEK